MATYQGIPWHTFRKLDSNEYKQAVQAQNNYLTWKSFASSATKMKVAAANSLLSLDGHTGELVLGVRKMWTLGLLKAELAKALDDVITGHAQTAVEEGLESILKRGLAAKTKAAFGWIGIVKMLADIGTRLKNERLLSRNDTKSIIERDRIKVRLIALCMAKGTGGVNIYRLQEDYYHRYTEYWKAHQRLLRWIYLDYERSGKRIQAEYHPA